jgi:hypothetical protein
MCCFFAFWNVRGDFARLCFLEPMTGSTKYEQTCMIDIFYSGLLVMGEILNDLENEVIFSYFPDAVL